MRPTLVVMVKEPRPGRVKTRLARDIGQVAATWWFRHQTARLIRHLARDNRWRLVLAVAPDAAGMASRAWPADVPRQPQGGGTLGDRMGRAIRSAPPGPVIIVGADIPGITPSRIAAAIATLAGADAVIGPAPDGGYWLIGLKRARATPARLFEGVRWSTAHARADTIATVPGLRVAETRQLRDVDTAADLRPAREDTE